MNAMKLVGVVLILLAVGAVALAIRQYQTESRDAAFEAMQTSQGINPGQPQQDVPVSGWGISAIGAVVLGAVGVICIAKSSGKPEC